VTKITGLAEKMDYYVRTYVTTAKGTAYSPEAVKFTTTEKPVEVIKFTQKVLIEQATGTWCGWCPRGSFHMKEAMDKYPGRVFTVVAHSGDPMAHNSMIEYYTRIYGLPGFPAGYVNRSKNPTYVVDPSEWLPAVDKEIMETAPAGLAISSSVDGKNVKVTAKAKFNSLYNPAAEYYILGFFTENDVTGYPQENYYSGNSSYKNVYPEYYSAPGTINDYHHKYVLRKVISQNIAGDLIAKTEHGVNKEVSRDYTFTMGNEVLANSHITFVLIGYVSGTKPFVVNTQQVAVGKTQDYD